MRPLADQSHYEILEVSPDASAEEIERAWRVARGAYAEESLAHYSVLGPGEAASILERVEQAWAVLSDPAARAAYDAARRASGEAGEVERATPVPQVDLRPPSQLALGAPDPEELEDEGASYDGPTLRRIRLRRGIELEQIAEITKVNPRYLRCIEEESFDQLPAPVYVRGFVTAYARAVRLDAAQVASHYMQRFNEVRSGGGRGRLLGRR